jgi:hypothetical protein
VRVAYAGHEALTFSDYIDLEAGKTLHARPGRVYDIAPASGRVVPEVPEPWFIAVNDEAWNQARAALDEALKALDSARDEDSGGEPDGSGDPGGDEGTSEQDHPEG